MSSSRLDLLVVADSCEGGLGASAQEHARWFAGQGWSVMLAGPEASGLSIAGGEATDVPVPGGAADVWSMLIAARHLRSVLRRRRPRVVHAHGTRSHLVTLLAGRVPRVTMHGGGRVTGQGAVGTVARRAARWSASWLAVRAYSAAPAAGRWRTLLHASPRLRELGQPGPACMAPVPTFLWVGRLDAPKQPHLFVRACALASRRRRLRGVILGDGPWLDDTRELAERLGAPVDVVGASPEVGRAIAESWAVCLFSGFEGVPFAVQEAMWSGRAVVLSPLPSLQWFAGSAATYAEDEDAAAAALVELCERDVAVDRGARAAARARHLLVEDAPFPQLMAEYPQR